MEKSQIQRYFDRLAPQWDAIEEKDDAIIRRILNNADIRADLELLDVACGTGILFPYYLERNVGRITGLDLSRGMLDMASRKFPGEDICLICADAETFVPGKTYDRILIYNAFPHFPNPELLIEHLSRLLNPGGILSVAHGMSRAQIDACHQGSACSVSRGLMPGEELKKLFEKHLQVTLCIDSDTMYQVCGQRL